MASNPQEDILLPPTTRKKQGTKRKYTRRKKGGRRKASAGHVEMGSANSTTTAEKPKSTRKSGRKGSTHCPICHKPVKGSHGLAMHNAKKTVQAVHKRILGNEDENGGTTTRRSNRTSPHVRVSRLRERWMYRANQAEPEVREAILDCIIDLSTEFR